MPELPDIEELTKGLDPSAVAVVKVVYSAFRQLEKYLEGMQEHFLAVTAKLEAENAELKRMLFGTKSERRVMPPARREAAKKAKAAESGAEKAARKKAKQKKRQERRAARKALPVVEERIEVPESELR